MDNTVDGCIEFEDLRTQKVKIGGRVLEMSELSGGRWEKFNLFLKFAARYEQQDSEDIASGEKVAEMLNYFKKEAVKLILDGADDDFLEKELPPGRLMRLIEIQKNLNGFQEVEEMLKNEKNLIPKP